MTKDISVIRNSIGKIVSMLTNRSIRVTQRGSKAYVSYHPKTGAIMVVNIPYLPDDASEDFVAAVQGFLDHEVGHVLFSDFAVLKKAQAAGSRIKNLHNVIEDVLIERRMASAFQGSSGNLNAVRSFYLNKIAKPKIAAALAAGDESTAAGYASVIQFRAWGGQTIAKDFLADNPKIAELVKKMGERIGPDLITELTSMETSKDALALTMKIHKALTPPPPPPPPPAPPPPPPAPPAPPPEEPVPGLDLPSTTYEDLEDEPRDEPEDEGTTKAEADEREEKRDEVSATDTPTDEGGDRGSDAESAGGDIDGEDDDRDAPDFTPGGDDLDDEEDDLDADPADRDPGEPGDTHEHDAPPSVDGVGEPEVEEDADADAPGTEGSGDPVDSEDDSTPAEKPGDDLGTAFDEERDFDKDLSDGLSKEAKREISHADYQIFSTDWDMVEPGPESRSPEALSRMVDKCDHMVAGIQKTLERAMAAKSRKAWNPGQRRGRISPGALFRTATGDDRVFRTRYETHAKNTAVSLLVDCSGSMQAGDRIGTAALASYALASTLERLKIKCEVMGFTTKIVSEMRKVIALEGESMSYSRTEALYMPVLKSFEERLTVEAKSRIAALTERPSWTSQNVDGECVQIAAQRLMAQSAERHILIVLSDGEPCCPGDRRAQDAHLKKVVADLTKDGRVEVIGVGIQNESVRRYYPKSINLNDLEDLPTTVVGQLSKLLMAD